MDHNYLMLLNTKCTSDQCNIDDENAEFDGFGDRLKDYCFENDNLVTEDICHNLYTNYVYRNYSSNTNSISKDTADSLSKKLYEVCEKYPMHIRCKCVNFKRTFDYDDNNTLSTYGYSCMYPKCSNKTANRDPNNSKSSLIPRDIYIDDRSCPENICQVIIDNSDFDLENSDISIANNCNNQENNKENNKNVVTNNSTEGKKEENNNNIIIIIVIAIIFIILVFLFLIILLVSKRNNRRRGYYP